MLIYPLLIIFVIINNLGSGATTAIIADKSKKEYFVKKGGLNDFNMLNAEFQGILDIYETKTIKVPQPIVVGTSDYESYAVFEKISIGGYGKAEEYALKLFQMHNCLSPNGKFGWRINNTIGDLLLL